MRQITYIIVLVLLTLQLVVFGSACSGPQTPMSVFDEQVDLFHGHMRWGRWSEASAFLDESLRADFRGEFDQRGDDFQVTEFEVEGANWTDSKNCTVTVWMQWYQLPNTRVQEGTWEEDWSFGEETRTWSIVARRKID